MRFAWDPPKAKANLAEHGVSLAEAVTVLDDDQALTREDPDAGAYREPDVLRVISAWKANKRQRVLYEKGRS
ncbi:MAG: BrnT family toxin [Candidatus Rokubacteria bacterium]|nr:BrnT family toxin [Candidatus Rokubacteria bacterium]